MDENPKTGSKTILLTLALILLFIGATLYWTPILDLVHRSRMVSSRDYFITPAIYSKNCPSSVDEVQRFCPQLSIVRWTSYGLFIIGLILLIWGLIKKKTNYDKKDIAIYVLTIIVCGLVFFTFSTYRLDKVIEKTPIETYDTKVTEHTITYDAESDVTEEVPVVTETVTYHDKKGNALKPLELTQTQQGVGSPCRPWAELKNPNEVNIDFDVNFTYTVYDIIAKGQAITVPDQTIKAGATTKVVYTHDEEGADAICKLSDPTFAYHEDSDVQKKVKTTTQMVKQTRRVQNNKTSDAYNETQKIARTQYLETIRTVGKWWWE